MKSLLTAGAARLAAQVQNFGANFDYEVLSLPFGSAIAIVLWVYSSTVAGMKRAVVSPAVGSSAKLDKGNTAGLPLTTCTGCCK